MTALNDQRPVPTVKVNKSCFMMQSVRCKNLKEFEGLRKHFKCAKKSLRYINKNVSGYKK